MSKGLGLFFLLVVAGLLSIQVKQGNFTELNSLPADSLTVEEVRLALGGEKLPHFIEEVDREKVRIGQELIEKGSAKKGLIRSKIISPYFVCTDCHSLNREFEQANDQDPEKRLAFAMKNGLSFLPGSTFWGIYNRTKFYNGDYIKKYGELIAKAKTSLPESIQVCAKYCSAGRNLKDWEVEAILHYFKANELRMKDLGFSKNKLHTFLHYGEMNAAEKSAALREVEAAYVQGFTAHFDETMPKEKRKYGEGGDAKKGEFIYKNACLFCHKNGRVTHLKLDEDKLSAQMFLNHMDGYSDKSIYQIIRYGTYTMPGRNQYMPRYTKEKMSDEQINDLMAYIKELAKK